MMKMKVVAVGETAETIVAVILRAEEDLRGWILKSVGRYQEGVEKLFVISTVRNIFQKSGAGEEEQDGKKMTTMIVVVEEEAAAAAEAILLTEVEIQTGVAIVQEAGDI